MPGAALKVLHVLRHLILRTIQWVGAITTPCYTWDTERPGCTAGYVQSLYPKPGSLLPNLGPESVPDVDSTFRKNEKSSVQRIDNWSEK